MLQTQAEADSNADAANVETDADEDQQPPAAADNDEDEVDEVMGAGEGMAFLQLQKPRKKLSQIASSVSASFGWDLNPNHSEKSAENQKREIIINLLKKQSVALGSQTLAMLASKVAA